MKRILLAAIMLGSYSAMAQPKVVTRATINTTTNVIAPEEEDVTNLQNQGGGGMFRNFGDGETKAVTQVKDEMVKTVIKSDMGRSTIIRNNETKMTTTLIEMMGNKTGFYITDAEQAELRKSMDSMMQARNRDSVAAGRPAAAPPTVDVVYTEETKKIAGYNCKKAFVVTSRLMGLVKDTAIVWYTPEFKVKNLSTVGGGFSMGMMAGPSNSSNGMDKIDGFVMGYETKMRRNRTMIVTVTKVDFEKDIAAKEFEVPKDFDVKPMKEMRNMMGGGQPGQFQMRRN